MRFVLFKFALPKLGHTSAALLLHIIDTLSHTAARVSTILTRLKIYPFIFANFFLYCISFNNFGIFRIDTTDDDELDMEIACNS